MELKNSFSGSNFEIFEKKNHLYLKKILKKIKTRDVKSVEKQINFQSYMLQNYKIQSAYITKVKKNKKYILMNYYEGLCGSDLILSGDIEVHKHLNFFLEKYLINILKNSKTVPFDRKVFFNKCIEIKKKTLPKYRYLFDKINKKLTIKMKRIKFGLSGCCHGDLTLSNIIFNKKLKKIILIDFLKSYNDSPIQDICKLIQDLRFYWSSRNLNKNDTLRAKIFCDNLKPFKILGKLKLFSLIEVEMLMTLLRILPYISSNDALTIKWVERSYVKLNISFLKKI